MRRKRVKLTHWTRDFALSSGRVVRAEWHPNIWAVGMTSNEIGIEGGALFFDFCLTEGELWEIQQRAVEFRP